MGDICVIVHIQCTVANTSVCFVLPPFYYGGWGGGRLSKNIQKYQQMCIECVIILMHIAPIFLWNPYDPNHPIPKYKPAYSAIVQYVPRSECFWGLLQGA